MSENIKIYKKTEEGYPKNLLQLPDAPSRLYVLGELPDPMRPAIAIVGARNCSSYGKNMAYEYARILTQRGIQVISGLARGVDAAAHAGALAAGGKTYGVMGCGVDFCYPTSSRKLYHVMQQQGGILSEFAPGTPPLSYHFPLRNRIISGLSGAILVVEAKEKSGSLITADAALEQGRTVFALPGRAGDLLSEGCNRLIYQGAIPAWKPEIILEEMEWTGKKEIIQEDFTQEKKIVLAREDDLVYSCLDLNPKGVSQLQDETGLPSGSLLKSLYYLTAKDLAREVWQNYYIRTEKRWA